MASLIYYSSHTRGARRTWDNPSNRHTIASKLVRLCACVVSLPNLLGFLMANTNLIEAIAIAVIGM